MTYLRHGVEYFEPDERECYEAMQSLVRAHRTANTSQIARQTGMSRDRVDRAMRHLYNRSYVRDAYAGAAHHWRPTNKVAPSAEPAPSAIETRHANPGHHRQTPPSDSTIGHDRAPCPDCPDFPGLRCVADHERLEPGSGHYALGNRW